MCPGWCQFGGRQRRGGGDYRHGYPRPRGGGEKPHAAPVFNAYGTPTDQTSDARDRAITGLLDEVQSLRSRLNALEGQPDANTADANNTGHDLEDDQDDQPPSRTEM